MAGSYGRIPFGSDFCGNASTAAAMGADLHIFGVGTEVYDAQVVDESGSIASFTTGGSDNDNIVIRCNGPFAPADGEMWVEARFKYSNVDDSIFVGFTETLDTTTPVMPAEFATATMTYNGTGGMIGLQYDADGTTDDFRAVMGDGGAGVSGSSTTGIRANATLTADRWFIARVELHPDGSGDCLLADVGHVDGASKPTLRLIKHFAAGLTPTDLFFPVLMAENRTANARTLEVDYFLGEAGRDWRPT